MAVTFDSIAEVRTAPSGKVYVKVVIDNNGTLQSIILKFQSTPNVQQVRDALTDYLSALVRYRVFDNARGTFTLPFVPAAGIS